MNIILRYRNIIIGAVIIFVFVIIIRNIHTNYSQQLKDVERQAEILEEGKKTLEKWDKLGLEYSSLTGKFLKKDVLAIKKYVEDKARKAGLAIDSLSISQKDQEFYWKVTLRLKTVCSYKDFSSFVKDLEDKRIQVKDVRVKALENNIRVDASVEGVVIK